MGRGENNENTALSETGARDSRKLYKLTGPDGRIELSETPGSLGGHRKGKIYGKLDCRSAASWIARGHYVKHRVFFRDEAAAKAAGYRPCARCMPEQYAEWKASQRQTESEERAERYNQGQRAAAAGARVSEGSRLLGAERASLSALAPEGGIPDPPELTDQQIEELPELVDQALAAADNSRRGITTSAGG